jgi:hypothetical protein
MQRWDDKIPPRTGDDRDGGRRRARRRRPARDLLALWRLVRAFEAKREVDKTGRNTAAEVVQAPARSLPGDRGSRRRLGRRRADRAQGQRHRGRERSTASRRRRGARADGKYKFRNKRAWAVWRCARSSTRARRAARWSRCRRTRAEGRSRVLSLRDHRGGILIETKEKQKERLGRSPDKGDAAMMCLAEGSRAVERSMRAGRARAVTANTGGRQLATVRR